MTLTEIYESAQIVRPPLGAFGGEVRVDNRHAMLDILGRHRRKQERYIALSFALVLAIFLMSLYIGFSSAAAMKAGALRVTLPLLGGGVLVALLGFLRMLLKTHDEGGMLEAMLHYASDEQLASYVELRLAIKRGKVARRKTVPPGSSAAVQEGS